VRLLAAPDLRRAAIWCCLGALAVLTHYHALLLIGLQGLGYLAAHRGRALRTWPAALAFLPVFAWIGLQLPRIKDFSDPNAAWVATITPAELWSVIEFVLGDVGLVAPLAMIAAIGLFIGSRTRSAIDKTAAESRLSSYIWIAIGTGALGATAIVIIGAVYPSFTPRYLMPFMPSILLGFAFAVRQLGRRWKPGPVAVLLVLAAADGSWVVKNSGRDVKLYNYEAASRSLLTAGAERVVFFFDNPLAAVYDPSQLKAAGGFFFHRSGGNVAIEPIYLRAGEDPNLRLVTAAAGPGSVILWIYDLNVRATAARSYPPRIEQIDPAWRCRDFAQQPFGVIACARGAKLL
jgi:hypothetical protein